MCNDKEVVLRAQNLLLERQVNLKFLTCFYSLILKKEFDYISWSSMNKEFITFLVVKYRVISMLVTKENKTKEMFLTLNMEFKLLARQDSRVVEI